MTVCGLFFGWFWLGCVIGGLREEKFLYPEPVQFHDYDDPCDPCQQALEQHAACSGVYVRKSDLRAGEQRNRDQHAVSGK